MVKILGVKMYDRAMKEVVEQVAEESLTKEAMSNCISTTGAHGLVYARQNKEFKEILNKFYYNLPDGMPNVWVGKLKGAKQMQRCYGTIFFEDVIRYTNEKPINHFLCGGKEGVAEELMAVCNNQFGNHHVVGTFCPPFRYVTDDEMRELALLIENSHADIVWIGISTPKQEKFAWRLKDFCKTHFIITIGAAFDFHTGKIKKAPNWIQKMGMEWFYRILMEPRRLLRRYAEVVPKFIIYTIGEFFTGDKD